MAFIRNWVMFPSYYLALLCLFIALYFAEKGMFDSTLDFMRLAAYSAGFGMTVSLARLGVLLWMRKNASS